MAKRAKLAKNKVGRPAGPEKKPLNVFLPVGQIAKLKDMAAEKRGSISGIIELALVKVGIN